MPAAYVIVAAYLGWLLTVGAGYSWGYNDGFAAAMNWAHIEGAVLEALQNFVM